MKFKIYKIYQCTRCGHFKLDADPEWTKLWRKMGYCRHFKQDVKQDPGRNLKNPGESCSAFDKRGKRGIASMR